MSVGNVGDPPSVATKGDGMPRVARLRFWLEIGLAAAACLLSILTVLWPAWIEAILDVDPDHGDGTIEWMVSGGLLLAAATFSVLAARESTRSKVTLT